MGTIIALIFIWFVVSIPVSLMIGAYFANSGHAATQATAHPSFAMHQDVIDVESAS